MKVGCKICGKEMKVSELYYGRFHLLKHKGYRWKSIKQIMRLSLTGAWLYPFALMLIIVLILTYPMWYMHEKILEL